MDLNELKQNWQSQELPQSEGGLTPASLQAIIKRTKRQKNKNMQYFWGSFIYQMIVHALLAHVGVKYRQDTPLLFMALGGILIYLPFTILLMRKFKKLAVMRTGEAGASGLPLKEYVTKHHALIKGFFRFKVMYETVLIPVSAAIFVWMFFRIHFTEGALNHPVASLILFFGVIAACTVAIIRENRRNFLEPLRELQKTLQEMEE